MEYARRVERARDEKGGKCTVHRGDFELGLRLPQDPGAQPEPGAFEVVTAEYEASCEHRAFQDGARFGERPLPGQQRFHDSAAKAFTNRDLAPTEFGNLAWGNGSCQGMLGGETVTLELGLNNKTKGSITTWLVKHAPSFNGTAGEDDKGKPVLKFGSPEDWNKLVEAAVNHFADFLRDNEPRLRPFLNRSAEPQKNFYDFEKGILRHLHEYERLESELKTTA